MWGEHGTVTLNVYLQFQEQVPERAQELHVLLTAKGSQRLEILAPKLYVQDPEDGPSLKSEMLPHEYQYLPALNNSELFPEVCWHHTDPAFHSSR